MKPYFFQIEAKTIESQENGSVIIEGMASTVDKDRYNDIVEPQAFSGALELYMKNPQLLRSHNHDNPVGRVISAKVTSKGLFIRAEITEERTAADVRENRMRAFSIGYIPKEWEVLNEDGEPFNPDKDNPWSPDNIRVIKELDLVEISIVTVPANGYALFNLSKSVAQASQENSLIIMKSMGMKVDNKNIPANELEDEKKSQEVKEAAEQEAAEAKSEEAEEATEETTEEGAEEEKAAEGIEEKSEDGESTESPEESENAEEDAAAESTEGEEAEEVSADDEPVEEGDEESSDEEKALLVVDAKTLDAFPMYREAGLMRLAEGEEKATELSEDVKSVLAQSQTVIDSLKKSYEDLTAKVADLPVKKALAPEKQLGDEEKDAETEAKKAKKPGQVSKGFANLFPEGVVNN